MSVTVGLQDRYTLKHAMYNTHRCNFEQPCVPYQTFNDIKHRAASMRQLSFLYIPWGCGRQSPKLETGAHFCEITSNPQHIPI